MTSLKTNKRVQSIITNKCHSITPDFNALYQTFCSIEVEINMYHHTQIFNVCTTGAGIHLSSPPPPPFHPKSVPQQEKSAKHQFTDAFSSGK